VDDIRISGIRTLYTEWGNIFSILCALITAACIIFCGRPFRHS
jgi:hypothetical protein